MNTTKIDGEEIIQDAFSPKVNYSQLPDKIDHQKMPSFPHGKAIFLDTRGTLHNIWCGSGARDGMGWSGLW